MKKANKTKEIKNFIHSNSGKIKMKEKKFKVKLCPKCKSDDIGLAIGGNVGLWECRKCGYRGVGIIEKEMTENEYFNYLDSKGVELPELGEPETVEDKSGKKSYKDLLRERVARGEKI